MLHQDNVDLCYAPLHIACREGHAAVVQELLEKRADIHVRNSCHSALTEAIDHDRQDIVKLLVSKMADVGWKIPEPSFRILTLPNYLLTQFTVPGYVVYGQLT